MNKEEIHMVITEAVSSAVSKAIAEILKSPEIHCQYKFDADAHEHEHEALRKFIRVMSRIEDMKWSVLQKIVIGIVGAAFVLMAYGAMAKLTIFGGLGWPGR
jgi:hypothetical protein